MTTGTYGRLADELNESVANGGINADRARAILEAFRITITNESETLDSADIDTLETFIESMSYREFTSADIGRVIDHWLIETEGDAGRAFIDAFNPDWLSVDEARDAFNGSYQGAHASPEEWALEYWDRAGYLDQIPADLQYYIDYEQFVRDAEMSDVVIVNAPCELTRSFRSCFVFWSNW